MTLHEKIQFYRKQARLSQEELAARVGVSRQAVSKWELGDATPEVDKLVTLAKVFGVTVDELLSPQEPSAASPPPPEAPPDPPFSNQRHNLGGLGRLIRRYGWLAGVYVALSGLGITLVGALARFAFRRMFQVTIGSYFSEFGWDVISSQGSMGMPTVISSTGEIFLTIATAILVVGLAVMVAGAVLAVVLYKKGRKRD
jgi:transcriptional regulator with XRE-family HTH domain